MKKSLSAWLPVALWCALIFYLSGIPHLRLTQAWWDIVARKFAHVAEFAVLARLVVRAWNLTTRWSRKKVTVAAFAFCVLYASTDEFHQRFVPGRVGCWQDVLIDSVGALAGLGAFLTGG